MSLLSVFSPAGWSGPGRAALLAALVAAAVAAAPGAAAQTVYIAFGDSITAGSFDDDPEYNQGEEKGYPPRLEEILQSRGIQADVRNYGFPGETTLEALSRIDRVLAENPDGDALLLMEGTNDLNRISIETIVSNLRAMARKATQAGVTPVHGTIIPRHPNNRFDGTNRVTRDLAGEIRELAHLNGRNLADPYEVFKNQIPNAFSTLYILGGDTLHPNGAGYDALAEIWADVLTGIDEVPPVLGDLQPYDDQQNVPTNLPVELELFDFGEGIDTTATRLTINGEEVAAEITGDERKQVIRYQPPEPWHGVTYVGLEAQDRNTPPNVKTGRIVQFVPQGTQFLVGDISRDGRVDGDDLISLALAFGTQRGMSAYRGVADLDNDDVVDGEDLALLAANFGETSF
ncbi:MAG TPA: GDSL-type esterase/lipase family protein [Thermoanaerobaculia bacterium]|nr:GDSL-type esterase/lipase family protein [Thermoanaerobaculia bacterium]